MFGPSWEDSIKLEKSMPALNRRKLISSDMLMVERDSEGVIPRTVREIFGKMAEMKDVKYTVYCSFIQIYNEKIFDLL
jgi:hypothetical protein